MTPAAAAFLAELRAEAAHWDDVTTTDAPALVRSRAEASRNVLDSIAQRLPRILADVEAEAVEEAMRVTSWLDDGVPV